MKISTEIGSAASLIGEEKAIEYIAKAGFDAWDFSMSSMCQYDWQARKVLENDHPFLGEDYLSFARKLKQVGVDNGIVCNQSHAPFPTGCEKIRSYFKRSIECTAEAGGQICVIHPDNDKSPEENAEMYWELLPFAKECGIKIAAENMWNWNPEKNSASFAACATPESFCAHLDAVHDDAFVACLHIGHAEMRGSDTSAVQMIQALGEKLQALHIHDNDQWHDLHQIPFSMKIDFNGVVRALKEIRYAGYFTLEADQFLKNYTSQNIFEGIKQLAGAAKRLADMVE